MNCQQPIKVLLVDDHQMVRDGLFYFLATRPDIVVVGQAESGMEAVQLVGVLQPDVVLMDVVMPGMDGLEATRIIREEFPDTEVLVLTSFIDDAKVVMALEVGATGYVMKDVKPPELARAVHAAARGELYLHSEAAQHLANSIKPQQETREAPKLDLLTERELEVLQLVTCGLSNQDIADELSVTLRTAKAHVSSLLQKLEFDSRIQLALYALQHDVVQLDKM